MKTPPSMVQLSVVNKPNFLRCNLSSGSEGEEHCNINPKTTPAVDYFFTRGYFRC